MEGMENVSHQLLQYNCTERQLADRSELDALLNAAELEAGPSTPAASKQFMQKSETEHIQH